MHSKKTTNPIVRYYCLQKTTFNDQKGKCLDCLPPKHLGQCMFHIKEFTPSYDNSTQPRLLQDA